MKAKKKKRSHLLVGFKVGKLTLKRGDVLILKTKELISDQTAKRIKKYVEMVIKGRGIKVMVLADGIDLLKLEIKK